MSKRIESRMLESFITVREVAKRLGYKCVKSVNRLMQRGELPRPVIRGGEKCLVASEFEAYIARKMAQREKDLERFQSRRIRPLAEWTDARDQAASGT